jgi:hypothetical protein
MPTQIPSAAPSAMPASAAPNVSRVALSRLPSRIDVFAACAIALGCDMLSAIMKPPRQSASHRSSRPIGNSTPLMTRSMS